MIGLQTKAGEFADAIAADERAWDTAGKAQLQGALQPGDGCKTAHREEGASRNRPPQAGEYIEAALAREKQVLAPRTRHRKVTY
jgi:hypothetical protein